MPSHWHLVAWPEKSEDLARFTHRLGVLHAARWHSVRGTVGTGALFQGRYKAFPAQSDGHALTVLRYVERNALRAGLVRRAEDWEWGSLWHRLHGNPDGLLSSGPVTLPEDWTEWVNTPQTAAELEAVRQCAHRGTPFGSAAWVGRTAHELGLSATLRRRGRPKTKKGSDPFSLRKGV